MIPRFPTLDHIIPKILGGSNQQDNLQLLCIACHRIKDDLSGYSKNKSDLYKMLKISFIQEYDGFASIIVMYTYDEMYDLLDICSCNHIVLAMPACPMVFVVPTKTTGHMNGLLLSLGGFSNCVLHTYSWLLHNGQQEIVFRTKGGEKEKFKLK